MTSPNKIVKTARNITLIGKNGRANAILVDLSLQALGVITPRGARVGTQLELEFEIPALEDFITLKIPGLVIHRHNSENNIYLKIEFENLTPIDKAALQDFIDYKNRLSDMGKRGYSE